MQQVARLAQWIVAAVRRLVVSLPALAQRRRVCADPSREIFDRFASLRACVSQHQRRNALEAPELARQRFFDCVAPDGRIDHEKGFAAMMLAHLEAEPGAVDFFVAKARAMSV